MNTLKILPNAPTGLRQHYAKQLSIYVAKSNDKALPDKLKKAYEDRANYLRKLIQELQDVKISGLD